MGVAKKQIDERLRSWIEEQPMFFIATAPTKGHINLSPKGYDSLRVTDPTTVVYLDLTGSGAETIAHVTENGRITFMWFAYKGKPNIVRAYGTATVHRLGSAGFDERTHLFDDIGGKRAIIETEVTRVSTSCGFSVPEFELLGERPRLREWAAKKGPEGVRQYQKDRNQVSIDGLPTHLH